MTALETVSADMTAENLYVSECEVETVSGRADLCLQGVVRKASEEMVSGNVKLSVYDKLLALDVRSVSGNMEISLPRDASFTLKFDSVSGDFGGDFSFQKNGKNTSSVQAKQNMKSKPFPGMLNFIC